MRSQSADGPRKLPRLEPHDVLRETFPHLKQMIPASTNALAKLLREKDMASAPCVDLRMLWQLMHELRSVHLQPEVPAPEHLQLADLCQRSRQSNKQ